MPRSRSWKPMLAGCVLASLAGTASSEPSLPDLPDAAAHDRAARALAGDDPLLAISYRQLCVTGYRMASPGQHVEKEKPDDFIGIDGLSDQDWMSTIQQPVQVFDNLYYIGYRFVGMYVVKTSQGLVLVDALDDSRDIDTIVLPAFARLGLKIGDIRYVVMTHAHPDHYGGIHRLLELNPAPKVVAGRPDAEEIGAKRGEPPVTMRGHGPSLWPDRFDVIVAPPAGQTMSAQDLTLGDTTIKLVLVPSHTPGMLSLIVPVRDHGVPHKVGMWGGQPYRQPRCL